MNLDFHVSYQKQVKLQNPPRPTRPAVGDFKKNDSKQKSRDPRTHRRAHTEDKARKIEAEKKQNPADLKGTTRASRGGVLSYKRGAA